MFLFVSFQQWFTVVLKPLKPLRKIVLLSQKKLLLSKKPPCFFFSPPWRILNQNSLAQLSWCIPSICSWRQGSSWRRWRGSWSCSWLQVPENTIQEGNSFYHQCIPETQLRRLDYWGHKYATWPQGGGSKQEGPQPSGRWSLQLAHSLVNSLIVWTRL